MAIVEDLREERGFIERGCTDALISNSDAVGDPIRPRPDLICEHLRVDFQVADTSVVLQNFKPTGYISCTSIVLHANFLC